MAGRLLVEAHAVVDGATLRVFRAIIEPANAREGYGRRAHRTGFQRDVEVGAGQPFLTKLFASHSNDGDFGMGGHVVKLARTVA